MPLEQLTELKSFFFKLGKQNTSIISHQHTHNDMDKVLIHSLLFVVQIYCIRNYFIISENNVVGKITGGMDES